MTSIKKRQEEKMESY